MEVENCINKIFKQGKVYKLTWDVAFDDSREYDWLELKIFEPSISLSKNSMLVYLGDFKALKPPVYSVKFLYQNKILYFNFCDNCPFF